MSSTETVNARISINNYWQRTEIMFHKITPNYERLTPDSSAEINSLTETIKKLARFLTVQLWEHLSVDFFLEELVFFFFRVLVSLSFLTYFEVNYLHEYQVSWNETFGKWTNLCFCWIPSQTPGLHCKNSSTFLSVGDLTDTQVIELSREYPLGHPWSQVSSSFSTRRCVFNERNYVKFIPNVVSIVDQVMQQGRDLVQMNTQREYLRIWNLQEQNEALRNQVLSMRQAQQTPILNEPQADSSYIYPHCRKYPYC